VQLTLNQPDGDGSEDRLPNVNLLLGVNGAGKTTVLKALALGTLSPVIQNSGYVPYYLVRRTKPRHSKPEVRAAIETTVILHSSVRRELRWANQLVKCYRLPAPNQEVILAALEEEMWPPRMDDPLPRQPDQDPKQRLHDTIKNLNRHQVNSLLVFKGDGTGEGVQWRQLDQTFTRVSLEVPHSFP